MTALRWQSIRIIAIALTFGGAIGVLTQALLFSGDDGDRQSGSLAFPATVPLKQWQQVSAKPVGTKEQSKGKQYQYKQNSDRVDIEVRYERYTDGNVSRTIAAYTPIKPATVWLEVVHHKDVGYYSLFEYDGKAYLSSCINPSGETTVTEQQFVQNKYAYGWSPQRAILWIIGQKDLLNGSCLWVLLSTTLPENSGVTELESAHQKLENVWFDWHQWWKTKLESET